MLVSRLIGILWLLILLLLQGCETLPPQVERTASEAFDRPAETAMGRQVLAAAQPRSGESGFLILESGAEALIQRATLIEAAQRSLDAQYYIWNSDVTGRYLARRLLLAADRGVRVRLLLDDFNLAGRDDVVAALDSHPNIAIRIYNPFASRSGLGRMLGAIGEFQRLNRRMHNKTFVVDGAVGIVGGRNIGDEYFGLHPEVNFRDRDILAAGPIVGDISGNFDVYWNSPRAYPIAALVDAPALQRERLAKALNDARAAANDIESIGYAPVQGEEAALGAVAESLTQLEWAPAELVFSAPVANVLTDADLPAPTARQLGDLMRASRHEILMESAYFILADRQLDAIRQLTDNGIAIKALTNSLASNDLIGNHAGYARNRKDMLRSGIALYELRPDARDCALWRGRARDCDGEASLHAKTMVFDREILYVGSFNLNLRSIYLNGETLLIVHSPVLAQDVAASIERALQPANSWRVTMNDDGQIRWADDNDDYGHEPASGIWRRFKAAMLRLLPIEKYY